MSKIKKNFGFLISVIAFAVLVAFMPGCQSGSEYQATSLLPGLEYQRPAFEFTEVVDGIYQARPTGNLPAWCNATIIINESDVVVVDTHVSPDAAAALLEEL
ncbi:unnamed protein product, partial [marine sediment metagenome]